MLLKLNNTDLAWEKESVKYLEIQLDKKLTFKQHVYIVLKKKANTSVSIFYSHLNKKSSSTLEKLLIFKVSIRPILTYSALIFLSMAATHHKKLKIFQNKTLRKMLNVPWDISTQEIYRKYMKHQELKK